MKRTAALILALSLLVPTLSLAEMMSITGRWVNFREGPSTKTAVVFKADKYYPVKVLKKTGNWAQVEDFQGDQAWISLSLLSKEKGVVIKANKANIRTQPSTKAPVSFTASKGCAFKVLEQQGDWVHVEHADGDKGWVHKSLVWGL